MVEKNETVQVYSDLEVILGRKMYEETERPDWEYWEILETDTIERFCDKARELIAMVCDYEELLTQDRWQPVETLKPDVMVNLACEWVPGDWRIKTGYWFEQEGRWVVFGASWTPTHWCPLPSPPKEIV